MLLLAALFAFASLLGHDPMARTKPRGTGSYWVMAAAKAPPIQAFRLGFMGAFVGFLYSAYYEDWRHVVFAGLAGFFAGTFAPIVRYRLGSLVVVTLALSGFMFGIRFDDQVGAEAVVFFAAMIAFAYSALIWGQDSVFFVSADLDTMSQDGDKAG